MSGRKQHYIPQCLLRQFAAKRTKKTAQVVVYKRGQHPFSSSTEGIAAKRDFYSASAMPGTRALDDEITAYENRIAPMLESMRIDGVSSAVDALKAAEVVAHLIVRGAFIRDLFASGSQEMLVTMGSLFSSQKSLRSALGIDEQEPRDLLQNALNSAYAELPEAVANQVPRPLFIRLASGLLRENFQDIHSTIAPQLKLILTKLQHELQAIARSGHAKALGETLAPNKKVEALASLSWSVRLHARHSLILPDCVALSEFRGGSFGPLQIHDNEKLTRVLLPISDHWLLVGEHADAEPYCLTALEFNRFASNSCQEFFVASCMSEELCDLAADIGRISRDFLCTTIEDVKRGFPRVLDEHAVASPAQPKTKNTSPRQISVSFLDCANKAQAQTVADIVASIVQAVSQYFSLNRLEAITFAHDYAAALNDLDRGHPELSALVPTEDVYGTGIAMAPLVLRGGQIRSCVIASSWVSMHS